MENLDALNACLAAEIEAFGSFLDVLRRENEALVGNGVSSLAQVANEKDAAFRRFNDLAADRQRAVAELGWSMECLDDHLAPHEETKLLWERLLQLAAKGREMNEVNGAIIGLKLQHNEQALAILGSAAGESNVYSRDGQARSYTSGRILGSG